MKWKAITVGKEVLELRVTAPEKQLPFDEKMALMDRRHALEREALIVYLDSIRESWIQDRLNRMDLLAYEHTAATKN